MIYKKKISYIIPAYNEQENIKHLISTIIQYNTANLIEIIVVDDNSTDYTRNIVWDYIVGFMPIKRIKISLLMNEKNMGKGYSIKKGLLYSNYPIKVILDADLSVQNWDYIDELKPNKTFVVKGQRKEIINQSIFRRITSFGYKAFVRFLFSFNVKDTQCPFTILVNVPKKFIKLLSTDGFAIDVDILATAKYLKIPVRKINVVQENKTKSSVRFKHIFSMLFETLYIKLKYMQLYTKENINRKEIFLMILFVLFFLPLLYIGIRPQYRLMFIISTIILFFLDFFYFFDF